MCGLTGFSGKYPVDVTKMRWLLAQNEDRGFSSTGIYVIKSDKNRTTELIKNITRGSVFVRDPSVIEALKGAKTVLGHTRAATSGGVTIPNAHPFDMGGIVGAHNGFVIQELLPKYGLTKEFPVDSMYIFAYLAKNNYDYRVLKEVEGAITIAYLTDKYPDVLHLYRREARELHIGYSKEGIYYSSAAEPLEMIACTNIIKIPDLKLVLLKDGEILDTVSVESPKIKSIPLNAKRDTWKNVVDKSEYAEYKDLSPPPVTKPHTPIMTNYSQGGGGGRSNFRQSLDNPSERLANDALDVIGSLSKLVMDDTVFLTSEVIPDFTRLASYTIEETVNCLVVLTLRSTMHGKDTELPGWIVYAKNTPDICGITQLNGTTVLRFPFKLCDTGGQVIVMADPVDGQTKFEFTLKPETGRLLEVGLKLPFPQTQKGSASNNSGVPKYEFQSLAPKTEPTQLSLLPSPIKRDGFMGCSTRENSKRIFEPEESLHQRDQEKDLSSEQERDATQTADLQRLTVRGPAQTNSRIRTIIPKLALTASDIDAILNEENNTFKLKSEIIRCMNGHEYNHVRNIMTDNIAMFLNVPRLMSDALVIKLHEAQTMDSYSLGVYAMRLLDLYPKKYYRSGVHISKLDEIVIDKFKVEFRQGKLGTQKKTLVM